VKEARHADRKLSPLARSQLTERATSTTW
jgi:hypothetical protein